jgi:hypothetical protein
MMPELTERHRELEAAFVEAVRTAAPVKLELSALEAVAIVGQIQLALRHPANRGESTKIARAFIEEVRRQVPEGLQRNIDAGFNPKFDV